MAYFPLYVNLSGKQVLIIGGGDVSFRQISTFLAFEADIVLLADTLIPELETLASAYNFKIHHINEKPSIETIEKLDCSPTLVIAATQDPALNGSIYDFYAGKNVLVENISNRAKCDFIFPAIIKRGDVVCSISSSGKSPLVSQFIKGLVESSMPENISDINEHMDEIYKAVHQSISDPSKRAQTMRTIFTRLIEDDNMTTDNEIDGIIGEAEL
ncbi:MAG: bifunctional precorrin-2 dehydrogenase/sirohydrochlorin ferrochelatase [Treponema sp.]|nr:bifunctional precorrin-2 dehydrogenase/sirohydrochlorin ferrochelatase [Treponema sp.]